MAPFILYRIICVLEKGYLTFWKHQSSTLKELPGSFPKRFLEQLLSREPAGVCIYQKEPRSRRYLRNFSEFWKHENIIWSLAIYFKETPLQSFSLTFSKTLHSPLKNWLDVSQQPRRYSDYVQKTFSEGSVFSYRRYIGQLKMLKKSSSKDVFE